MLPAAPAAELRLRGFQELSLPYVMKVPTTVECNSDIELLTQHFALAPVF